MGLFTENEKNIEKNYVYVVDVLETLYQLSDNGWFEVLHFLKESQIDSITTYLYSDDISHKVVPVDKISLEKVYEGGSSLINLKQALCSVIANHCDSLDGEDIENKIIAESILVEKFKKYLWRKDDIAKVENFKKLNLISFIGQGRPVRKEKSNLSINEAILNQNGKYEELIFCMEDFSHKFNKPIAEMAKFLKSTKFYQNCDVYIRIGSSEFIKLNKANSEKSLLFVLDFLDDTKFSSIELGLDTDFYSLTHILIDSDDFYFYEPLKKLNVDVRMGYTLYTDINYGEINHRMLGLGRSYHYKESKKIWHELSDKFKQEASSSDENFSFSCTSAHPSINPEHPKYAPELLIAIKAWEEKYLNNQYPHQEHTPAITQILKNKDITQTNLVKRICAITNPKK